MTEFGLRLAISLTQIAAVMGIVVVTVLDPHPCGTKGPGLDAGPHGPDGSGSLRHSPTVCGCHQTLL